MVTATLYVLLSVALAVLLERERRRHAAAALRRRVRRLVAQITVDTSKFSEALNDAAGSLMRMDLGGAATGDVGRAMREVGRRMVEANPGLVAGMAGTYTFAGRAGFDRQWSGPPPIPFGDKHVVRHDAPDVTDCWGPGISGYSCGRRATLDVGLCVPCRDTIAARSGTIDRAPLDRLVNRDSEAVDEVVRAHVRAHMASDPYGSARITEHRDFRDGLRTAWYLTSAGHDPVSFTDAGIA